MAKIDLEVDDFINYCDYKNLSVKTIGSYEQTLRLFTLYLKKECKVKEVGEVKEIHIMEYMKHLQEIGKYTVVSNENTKSFCTFRNNFTLFNEWMKKVVDYANRQIRKGELTQEHAQLICDGFSMLDEVTTQDRAEDFVYSFSGKERPQQFNVKNKELFNEQAYKTNFDYYGELQTPAIMFARTLRGIGNKDNDSEALQLLSKRALSSDFFDTILEEYSQDDQMRAFIREVQYMGLLKRASYANFGAEDNSYCKNSASYLSELTNITSQMRD